MDEIQEQTPTYGKKKNAGNKKPHFVVSLWVYLNSHSHITA